MNSQWIAMEHYRLHSVEQWPDSDHKQATLAGILGTLRSLSWGPQAADDSQACSICIGRKKADAVIALVARRRTRKETSIRAA